MTELARPIDVSRVANSTAILIEQSADLVRKGLGREGVKSRLKKRAKGISHITLALPSSFIASMRQAELRAREKDSGLKKPQLQRRPLPERPFFLDNDGPEVLSLFGSVTRKGTDLERLSLSTIENPEWQSGRQNLGQIRTIVYDKKAETLTASRGRVGDPNPQVKKYQTNDVSSKKIVSEISEVTAEMEGRGIALASFAI